MSALVTGGTRGIGLAISKHLADLGHPVAMVYVQDDVAAAEAERSIEGERRAIRGDVSTAEGIASVYDCAEEELGPVVVVVHSAVIPLLGKVSDIPVEYLDRSYAVGPRAFFLLCRAAAERMSPGGHIIQINSIGTPRYSPGYGAIGPAKAAMNQLMVHFAVELAPKGIRVNGVASSTVESKYIDGHPDAERLRAAITRKTPVGRMGTEADIARTVGLLCSSDADFIVGQTIVADGGLTHKV